MPGLGERASRLWRFAQDLRPLPEKPYYLHTPNANSDTERAPGWYMRQAEKVVYLGASAGDAEQWIRDQLRAQARKRKRSTA